MKTNAIIKRAFDMPTAILPALSLTAPDFALTAQTEYREWDFAVEGKMTRL